MKSILQKIWAFIKRRPVIQAAWTLITNPHIGNFFTGRIYTGKVKNVCVPGLNCYSCPAATAACPIGALQAQLGGGKHGFAFYTVGILIAAGALVGRLVCGFLCPFGFIQDLLHRIPVKKLTVPKRADKKLRYIKYAVLLLLVIILPIFLTDANGIAVPWFCKLVCPAGTLGGGVPLVIANEGLRPGLGALFAWKMFILAAVIVMSVLISRFFCKYLCPLGAIYSLFNKVSFYRMSVDGDRCVKCGLCAKKCPMDIDPVRDIDSLECIRCGECKRACPHAAIASGFCAGVKHNKTENKTVRED